MSEIKSNDDFSTKLKNETFLRFADNSKMGVLIIQRGFLKYFNKQFIEIFGYTKEDILKWRKREFYKIVHPEDLPNLVKNFKIEDDRKTVTVQFRGVKKDKTVFHIMNYICHIKFNNKTAYLSSYVSLEEPPYDFYISKLIKTKSEKIIILKYQSDIVKFLEDNNLKFEIIKHVSYREEN